MRDFSEEEVTYLLKALVEQKADLERMDPYPEQRADIQPFQALIKEFIEYRKRSFPKRSKRS